ncbi:MAG: LUD domain-containing protein, partial [Anaerolineales bacterium]|nr:LUD domain-containing protein [Anaerolineales bacterium]
LVYVSGNGRYRATSLLPPVHVALINRSQIVPNLESWVESQYGNDLQAFQHASNVVLISGASRTADIALELILGMHGPGEMHILILPDV